MNETGVRLARKDEIPLVRSLFLEYAEEIRRASGVDLAFQSFDEELATLPGKYAAPKGAILLGEVAGVPVGVIALRPLEDGVCEMKRLYLRPTARGLNLGRLLVETLLAEARKIGYRSIRLDSLPHMQGAIGLYRSLGFRDIAPYHQNSLCSVYLELEL